MSAKHVTAEATKVCTKCARVLPMRGFYRDKQKKDGRMAHCAECARTIALKWRYENLEKANACFRKWYATHVKENTTKSLAYQKRNPVKCNARVKLNRAIKKGLIERMPCEVCSEPNAQGHHEDYSRPLDVHWLCRRCHAQEHRQTAEGLAAVVRERAA